MRKLGFLLLSSIFYFLTPINTHAANAVLLGWNNLGMHCMDSRYAEFSILPPYNTIDAQLIVGGKLVTATSTPGATEYSITYEAVADPVTGLLNSTSKDKSDWAKFAPSLFPGLKGLNPPYAADIGLAGCNMPGVDSPYVLNTPQPLVFQPSNAPLNSFQGEGIPITPTDDEGNKNTYPMMRLVARNSANAIIAQSDIVLPVSDEMSCKTCHAANTNPQAKPAVGWITDANPEREYRLNILKRHDEQEFSKHLTLYSEALAAKGIDANGLYSSATVDQDANTLGIQTKPVLCASCHSSEALGTPSFTGSTGTVSALTAAVHSTHSNVSAPGNNLSLNDSNNRSACYDCHPGSKTRCLRGAMGSAVATDGSMEMQCQSCHGNMSKVGDSHRTGWLQEPTCQSCHTGTAISNNGKIRYSSVFNNPLTYDSERVAVNQTFATNPDTPAPGLSLYRFSKGHGGLQCSACHGSTHAEFPSSHQNDNIRNEQLQGHAGVTVECKTCHTTSVPNTVNGGPHGLHPIDQNWVNSHHDSVEQVGVSSCKSCHGSDLRGTELSRFQGDRNFRVGDAGTQKFYRGGTVGCYTCHQGPNNDHMNTTPAPVTADVTATTVAGTPVDLTLPGNVAGVTLRILKQPQNGTVGLNNGIATYFPFEGFTGTDTFLFAGYDGSKNTNTSTNNKGTVPATGTVVVNNACSYSLQPNTQSASDTGGGYSSNLTTAATCQWQAQSNSPWIAVNSASSSVGNGTFQYTISANTLPSLRSGSIIILNAGNQQVAQLTINQAAGLDSDVDGVVDNQDNCKLVSNTSQLDSDGDHFGNACDADFNNDCKTNSLDLGKFKSVYGISVGTPELKAAADFNGDGKVNSLDLGLFNKLYGKAPGPSGLAACP
ncbi:dockerin type I domain-containing protein (plasmid) [Methylomonas sp. 2BW1-5-20]|uniref:dockerin type I domain-containing protein n=1 Tax=Methylomonas sp. 2BW1-5-20 TaxID=3376686 RepID=UPI0040529869